MKNAFTVDLEDWFCSHNLLSAIQYKDWPSLESRVEQTTYSILNLLDSRGVHATFFVLGWVADHFPDLVRDIQKAGHEIASHGYSHRQITLMTPDEFRLDTKRSMDVLEQITGERPAGFRAPAFSITPQTTWAYDILRELGFSYDSSAYPFSIHPDYGDASIPLGIHKIRDGLTELPLSCATVMNRRLPCSGGAYLRFYPYPLFRTLARKVNTQGRPFIFYIHPWEIDPHPPHVKLPFSKSVRHYYNSSTTFKKIARLLGDFEFTSIRNLLSDEKTEEKISIQNRRTPNPYDLSHHEMDH